MKQTHIALSAFTAVLAFVACGCVTHTTIKDAARNGIQFVTPLAAQTFYEAYLSASDPQGHGSVEVYLPLPYSHRTVSTDNVRFNSAAQVADSNHDGIISEEEARAFAAQAHTRKVALSSK
jgi:hypothetical protein